MSTYVHFCYLFILWSQNQKKLEEITKTLIDMVEYKSTATKSAAKALLLCTALLPVSHTQNLRSIKNIKKASRELFSIKGNAKFELKSDSSSSFRSFTEFNADNNGPHPSFELIDSEFLNELNAQSNTYKHKKTGAEIFFINWSTENNNTNSSSVEIDDESTFGIFFRTPPEDSTGVPHILEHSVLTGSRKYTTKSPFVDLLKGSMNTFLNALTWPDRTGYVVASRNVKDFHNLMNVYLDAVFFPRVVKDPHLLAQEGYHLEPSDFGTLDDLTNVRDVELVRITVVINVKPF